MVFIILQCLSFKFIHFLTVIETRLDDEEEPFSLENLSKFLLKHEKAINKKVLGCVPKNNNIYLGVTKPHFKKKHHKSYSYAHKNGRKGGNKHHEGNGKSNNGKAKFDKNCNICGIYGHKESHYFKKKKEENRKEKVKSNKGKRNNKSSYVCGIYSMSQYSSNDWIVYSRCTSHICFEKDKFQIVYKHKNNGNVIGDKSML